MFILGNILLGVAEVLDWVLVMYMWVIIARALISWVNPDPYNTIVQVLHRLTEPALKPLRKLVPAHRLGIDLSPIIAILIITFARKAVVATLYRFGMSLT
ncbi:MAG: YggT family protein [Nitrospirota bacterium]